MKHQSRDELGRVAELSHGRSRSETMSHEDRLRRWVQLLKEHPGRLLGTLYETEYRLPAVRNAMRCENSAISVAFEDPLLRADGLQGDTYGDAKTFFGLSDRQLHLVVCYCHNGTDMHAGTAARRLESFLRKANRRGFFPRALLALSRGF
jgi:hypothetical protein